MKRAHALIRTQSQYRSVRLALHSSSTWWPFSFKLSGGEQEWRKLRDYQGDIEVESFGPIGETQPKVCPMLGISGIYESDDKISGAICDRLDDLSPLTLRYEAASKLISAVSD